MNNSIAMEAKDHKVKILGASAVKAKMRRMAYEVYENNFEEQSLILIGIGKRGGYLATRLAAILREISPLRIELLNASKTEGDGVAIAEADLTKLEGEAVLVVDDVLYSGLTIFHTVAAVMQSKPKAVQTAVLIDRGHRNVPMTSDFVGMELATSLKQYVSVEVSPEADKAIAYLF